MGRRCSVKVWMVEDGQTPTRAQELYWRKKSKIMLFTLPSRVCELWSGSHHNCMDDFKSPTSLWQSIYCNTTRVAGTFGYMYPEYALDGIFSVKSDVYSFGVLVLEIVSGTKMTGFYRPDLSHNLLAHVWRLYKDDKFWELIDEEIVESCNPSEAFRAIQIGLLCGQPYPEDRPSMSLVILMRSSEIEMPQPEQPDFFTRRTQLGPDFGMPPQFSASVASTLLSPRLMW